jgi:tetratricopeptide (TPR) repeat protein
MSSPRRLSLSGKRLPSPSPGVPGRRTVNRSAAAAEALPLAGQLVVFTGKLSSLGRRDARALVARLGGATADDVNAKTTMLVIGDEGPATAKSNKLKRAEELGAEGTPIRIVPEEEFCRLVGVPTVQTLRQQYHSTRDLLARYRLLREDHLRYLVKCGVIQPVVRTNADTFFAFGDMAIIKQANDDMAGQASFRAVARNLIASRQGQLAFDFRLDAAPAKILTLQRRADRPAAAPRDDDGQRDTALAEQYFRMGSAFDDGDELKLEQAATAYRKALELDPCLVAGLINLANVHYSRDEVVEAQALYERAIGLEPDFFEAHFNLGNIYHDLGNFDEAQSCYLEALRLNPQYADAHFYLAVTFEKMGQSQEARPHWKAYRELAPHGEWVELAKEFSE